MNKKSWFVLSTETKLTGDEVYQHLLETQSRIIVLSGKSGCGKTSIIKKLKDESGLIVNSVEYRFLTNYICRRATDEPVNQEEFDEKIRCDFFCVEDIDFLAGKLTVQECVGELLKEISIRHKVIITGIDVGNRVDALLKAAGDSCEEIIYSE